MIKHYKIEIKRWGKDGINEINTIFKFLTNLDSFLISFILKRWHESSKRQSVRARIFMNDSTYDLPQSKAVTLELAFEESRDSAEPPVVKRRAGCPLALSMIGIFHLYTVLQ